MKVQGVWEVRSMGAGQGDMALTRSPLIILSPQQNPAIQWNVVLPK